MPTMFDCPFNVADTPKANNEILFYLDLTGTKFRNIVEYHKQFPSYHRLSIDYKNDTLQQYYGLLRDEGNDGGAVANTASSEEKSNSSQKTKSRI